MAKAKDAEDDDSAAVPLLDVAGLRSAADALEKMDEVFGIFYEVPATEEGGPEAAAENGAAAAAPPPEILDLVARRTAAKEAKDWELADSLRAEVAKRGFAIEDGRGACQVRRL